MATAQEFIQAFEHASASNHRYASFDYCFNYFHQYRAAVADAGRIQESCMHLGAYLASWGMFRASSFLLKTKSMRHFKEVIAVIASDDLAPLWDIDCDAYTGENIAHLLRGYKVIRNAVIPDRQSELKLITKIMLGVFGCVPAFDTRFTATMRTYVIPQQLNCGFCSFNRNALECIAQFYRDHHEAVGESSAQTHTYDFNTGERLDTDPNYTKAKIVDMIGFQANGAVVEL